jgi:hypothetical protein
MIAQSKTIHQAEIDAACELIDFLRYNVEFMTKIYADQPASTSDMWNRVEYRPLEGFVYAITPFNFTAIAGNLPSSAALMGNVVVWKPAATQVYSANVIMQVFKEAGLPDGVINMVMGDSGMVSDVVLSNPHLAGVHFTGSTGVFNDIWKTIGQNIANYKTYPRIVGETGGKDFIIAHPSANPTQVAVGIARGAFEFQGQKCSAASRAYIPSNIWPEVKSIFVGRTTTNDDVVAIVACAADPCIVLGHSRHILQRAAIALSLLDADGPCAHRAHLIDGFRFILFSSDLNFGSCIDRFTQLNIDFKIFSGVDEQVGVCASLVANHGHLDSLSANGHIV